MTVSELDSLALASAMVRPEVSSARPSFVLGGLLDGLFGPVVRIGGVGMEASSDCTVGDVGAVDAGASLSTGAGVEMRLIRRSMAEAGCLLMTLLRGYTIGLMASTRDWRSLPLS